MYMELKRKRIQIRKYNVAEYQKEAMRQLQSPENLTVSEWAEKYSLRRGLLALIIGSSRFLLIDSARVSVG